MTVSTTHNEISYTATGGDTFAYTFLIAQASDLLVYVDDVVQALGYSVTQVGDPAGGNVVFAVAPAVDATVRLLRSTEITQEVDLLEGSRLPADQVEGMWDKLTLICQDLDGRVDAVETDIADITIGAVTMNLVESTRAGLPTAGTSGLLRHVTDDVRGVWMDTGAQWMPLNQHVLDVRAFGALCDDTTDDAAAIQAAIDVAGDTSSISRAGVVVLIPGKCAIGSTLLIQRKSITLAGLGWGLRGGADPTSYLRWIGAAGTPMVRLQDTRGGARIRDLRFIGASAAKPDSAISLYESDDASSNSWNLIDNIHIGMMTDEADATTQFVHGIRVEGALNVNNAEMTLRNIRIQGCETGIRVGGTQNVVLLMDRLTILQCQYGIQNSGHIVGSSWFFSTTTGADLHVPTTDDFSNQPLAQFHITDYSSEGAARLALIDRNAILSIRGGYFQLTSTLNADGKVIKAENQDNQYIAIRDYRITQGSAPSTAPFLSVKSPGGGASAKHLILDGVRAFSAFMTGGPNANGIDVETQSATDLRSVFYRDIPNTASATMPHFAQNMLTGTSGLQWDPKRWDVPYSLALLAASPTQLTADQNDYDPSRAAVWRLSSDAARTLTGIAGGYNGRLLYLANVGAQNLVLANQHASSVAANRLITGTGASLTVVPDETVLLIYDATTARWRVHHRLLSSAILTDPVLSGTVTGTYTLGGTPTLSGTIAGTPTWASGQTFPTVQVGAADVALLRETANILSLQSGTSAQGIRLYGTFTNSSNYERLNINSASSLYDIATAQAGTGVSRSLRLYTNGAGNLDLGAGSVIAWRVTGAARHLIAITDNTFDIGASGATRPRDYYGAGKITSAGATAGIGYATGAGGTVTQATSKATGVTLDKVSGQITLHNATLNAGTSVGFTLTNSAIATTDVVVVSIDAGATADSYFVGVDAVGAGSCRIHLRNVSAGNLGEAVVLNFVVIKGVAA